MQRGASCVAWLLAFTGCEAQQNSNALGDYRDRQSGTLRQAVCLVQPPAQNVCASSAATTIKLPPNVQLADVTLLATDVMELRDVTVPGTVVSLGWADTVVYSGATIGNIYSRGLVDLRSGATVTGFIKTTTPVIVQGSANYNPSLVNTNTPFDPTTQVQLCFPEPSGIDQSPNVYVDVNQTQSLAPGVYNDVNLRNCAQLVLSPGLYWFDTLQVEPSAFFKVNTVNCTSNCSVVVNVRGQISPALRGSVQPAGSNFLLNYKGTQQVLLNATFDGFIVAMNADLRINNNEPHRGAYFAKRVYVDAGQTITARAFPLETFQHWQP
jgi:hypothetical protein